MKLSFIHKKIISDTLTPVGVYLNVRQQFPGAIMLESSDYHGDEHNFSYICIDKIARVKLENGDLSMSFPGGESVTKSLETHELAEELNNYISSF